MLNVQLYGDFEFSRKDLLAKNYEKSILTDCFMKILIDEKIFYDDWICPLELYFQYLDWIKNSENNSFLDFNYISDDNGKNPILSFILVKPNRWKIHSCICLYDEIRLFETFEILDFFNSYEKQLLKYEKR